MDILIACEESQRVCECFRKRGHKAYSCDIEECSGGHEEWHIKADVLPLLNGNCEFTLMNGDVVKKEGKWDMIIAFPPCTHLAISGARHFESKRKDGRQAEAIEFFSKFLKADCDKIAIENPVGIISGTYIAYYYPELCKKYNLPLKPTQIIQPYYFGDPHKKTTCLWLKGLPSLTPTKIVDPTILEYTCKDGKVVRFDEFMVRGFKGDRAKARSKTFPGIAEAMSLQWG